MTLTYDELLARRLRRLPGTGKTVDLSEHPHLAPFQREIVTWACEVGRPAIWADTGLGKTRMQVIWASLMAETSLIITPLAVAQQTVAEAQKIGIRAEYVRAGVDVTGPGVWVTNVEMIDAFDPALFGADALD